MYYLVRRYKFLVAFVFLLILFLIWFDKKSTDIKWMFSYISSTPRVKIIYTREDDAFRDSLKSFDNDEAYEIIKDISILPQSAKIVAKKIFPEKPLVVWATEWHMTPIKDLKILLSPFGVTFLDYNLDPWRCAWHDCKAKEKLKVIS